MKDRTADLLRERTDVDRINSELLQLLAERFRTILSLSDIKYQMRMPCLDPQRVAEMNLDLEKQWSKLPEARDIPWPLVGTVFAAIFKSSVDLQLNSRRQTPNPFPRTTSNSGKEP